jgi:ubiquinone/menaquinone biosynthesis C-methylase UbiE
MNVGTEAGRFSSLASEKNATVIGIDIDSYGLKRLKLETKNVDVIQADARKIQLKDSTFDAVFIIEVLDYRSNLDEA